MAEKSNNPDTQELIKEINRLNRLSVRGILALALFLGICILAWQDFKFLPYPETVTALLGKPPSSRLINGALIIYSFAAIILSLGRMAQGVEHKSSFCHVGYLTVFMLFYYYSRSLEQNFWAVLGAGLTILGVESYRIWAYCAESIVRIKESIEFIKRTGRLPTQE
jgi:hypothetical protein